ncbi:hypothetical protein ACJIZ3_024446 [Penstemon smallii]|uniref:RecQ mediated genome instability protein 1 OB-fold domain-containing protein n=1 Tax=Penstemon smallii TaxID=265156 RepID=A0ABD3TS33_9LAMI
MKSNTASSSSSSPESLLQAVISRGWCFRDSEQIQGLIGAQLSSSSHGSSFCTVDSIESELLNMDLRSIGGKCLPQPSLLSKTPHLQGPIVLQVCSSRDISRSSIVDASGNSGNRRLLRLKLTDGHSEITAVEYSHVPSIPDDVIPGTKVRLQNKANICSGIVCLNNKVITILGGAVQSLYEEWHMNRKFLDVSRVRLSHENASGCPPPFEKLQIRAPARGTASVLHNFATKGTHYPSETKGSSGSSSMDSGQSLAGKGQSSDSTQIVKLQNSNETMGSVADDVKLVHNVGENKENPSSRLTRPIVSASVPVQNQEAAQKLLQKTSQPNINHRNFRSQRHRGKEKEEESTFLTLDEWERRKTGRELSTTHVHSNISQDEDLARQLQEQFDLENIHDQKGPHVVEAKDIKMSMFNFERDDVGGFGRAEFRGRGRGGRGRRSRGRGRF